MKHKVKNILKNITSLRLVWFIVLAILIVDQIIKFEVKSTMSLGESIPITSWFKITFIENNGMAYGMTFINKIVLSVFRLIAITAIGYYVCKITKATHRKGYVACLALVLAGAIGNMIDSMFYGLIFNASTPFNVSELGFFWNRLCRFSRRKSCRHVLFSFNSYHLARMGSSVGRT